MSGYVVYFLLLDGAPVYIGHTRNLRTRMYEHNKTKVFNCLRWIPCDDKTTALYYEKRWQAKFKPKHNINGTLPPKPAKVRKMNLETRIEKVNEMRYRVSMTLNYHQYKGVLEASKVQDRSLGNYISWCVSRGLRNDQFLDSFHEENEDDNLMELMA